MNESITTLSSDWREEDKFVLLDAYERIQEYLNMLENSILEEEEEHDQSN